ncbi:RnfABCDGE type electron transport complex subunit A [Eubacteriales bacterium OttesenSCG-928-M02]|nr:RnfABCDGE type electron transport complex subunit A [Eubacteriales bacterium OttesenSCG-928-M02]
MGNTVSIGIIIINAIFVENIVLAKFLGICPFVGVSKRTDTAIGMGLAVTFVIALSSVITYLVRYFILEPFHLEYMQTIAFILVIAALVQVVEMFLRKSSPTLYQALGIYLPLITTNCAVLGAAILNITSGFGLLQTFVNGTATGISFTFAIVLFAGVRERLELAPIPKSMEGFPIALVAAGLMAMAFLGFGGLTS